MLWLFLFCSVFRFDRLPVIVLHFTHSSPSILPCRSHNMADLPSKFCSLRWMRTLSRPTRAARPQRRVAWAARSSDLAWSPSCESCVPASHIDLFFDASIFDASCFGLLLRGPVVSSLCGRRAFMFWCNAPKRFCDLVTDMMPSVVCSGGATGALASLPWALRFTSQMLRVSPRRRNTKYNSHPLVVSRFSFIFFTNNFPTVTFSRT